MILQKEYYGNASMLLDVKTNQLEQLMEQGLECLQKKQLQQALLYFNHLVLLAPKHIEALMYCADILIRLNRPAEAAIYSQYALQFKPEVSTLTLHAKALYQMGKYPEALKAFESVIANGPNNYIAIGQRALCLTQVNRYPEALEAYQQALAYNHHQDPWVYYNYSLCLLAMGYLPLGFHYFEYRWLCALQKKNRAWKVPQHINREALQGKSIFIHSEQGLGDNIQFFRYIPLLLTSALFIDGNGDNLCPSRGFKN